MARIMAKICLFTFFLQSQLLISSFLPAPLAASAFVETDVQRDLAEIESLHETELLFKSQFQNSPFCHTDCQFYDRADLVADRKNRLEEAGHSRQRAGLELLKPDVPPAPRAAFEESDIAAALNTAKSQMGAQQVLESSLCRAEHENVDVAQHHSQSIQSRPVWDSVARFLASQRSSLNKTIRFTQHNAAGFCSWADERIESAQILLVNDEPETNNSAEELEVEEPLVRVSSLEIPMFQIPIFEEPVSLEPIRTRKVPMFEIAILKETVVEGVFQFDVPEKKTISVLVFLDPIETTAIPMFHIPDVEPSETADQSELSQSSIAPASELELQKEIIEPASSVLPDEVFTDEVLIINETEASNSIDLKQSSRDPYWQYYDDCDRWGVGFAKLILEAQADQTGVDNPDWQKESASASSDRNGNRAAYVSPLFIEPLLIKTASSRLVQSLPLQREAVSKPLMRMWQEVLDQNEFRSVEEHQHHAILFREQPLSPFAALALIRKPFSDQLGRQLGIESTNFRWLLDTDSLSRRISEIQCEYAGQIRELSARSEAMQLEQRQRSLSLSAGLIANQCRRLADSLDRFADSISTVGKDVAVAKNGKSTTTK